MQIIIGQTAGFCFGVSNAIKKTEEKLHNLKKIYCLGDLVHNNQVIQSLEKQGIEFIDDIEKAKDNIIIRTHGADKSTYVKAKELKLKIIDLTCPKVSRIHKIAEEYSNKDYYIFLIAQKDHPETIGTFSFCGDNAAIIENAKDLINAVAKFKISHLQKLLIISQTTFSVAKFNELVLEIKNSLPNYNVEIINTICNATKIRQEETVNIAKKVELMVIVGDKSSSNTSKLYELSKSYCKNVLFIQTENDIDLRYIKQFKKIGIMAGASTPKENIEKIVDILKKTC